MFTIFLPFASGASRCEALELYIETDENKNLHSFSVLNVRFLMASLHLHQCTLNAGISLKSLTGQHQQKEKIQRYRDWTRERGEGRWWRDKEAEIKRQGKDALELSITKIKKEQLQLKYFSNTAVMNKVTFTLPPPLLPMLFPMSLHLLIHSSLFSSHHPSTPSFWSSEIPKDSDPMKSLRLVRSQSHTSTDRRRSLSYSFRWLEEKQGQSTTGWRPLVFLKIYIFTLFH